MIERQLFSWRLGEYMIQKGWITWEQLQEALSHQEKARKGIVPQIPGKPVFSADKRNELSLGEILVRNTWITWDQLQECLEEQANQPRRIGEILLEKKYVSEENLARGLAIQYNLAFVDLDRETVSDDAVRRVPKEVAYELQILPLIERAGIFLIALADPTHVNLDLELKNVVSGAEVHSALATPTCLRSALLKHYGSR